MMKLGGILVKFNELGFFPALSKFFMEFQSNVLLKNHTTFKIGGPAKYFYIAKNKSDLIKAVEEAKKRKLRFFILAAGSNLLIADKGYQGLVIKIKNQNFKSKNNIILSEAGTLLSQVVSLSLRKNLTGLEWAAGIPGTVGGAVAGNAGAFGGAMKDVVKEVEVFDVKQNKIRQFKNKDCEFSYRNSIFKKTSHLIILSSQLQLKLGNKQKIKSVIQEHLDYRDKRHPKTPSAGSVFQNVKIKTLNPSFFKKFPQAKKAIKENVLPAAFLIDQCGLKGKKIGQAQISQKHPNFIINLGSASSQDVILLINLVKKEVNKKFKIKLKEEIIKIN